MKNPARLSASGMFLLPAPALAHGGGLFLIFVGGPLAAIVFLISAAVVRGRCRRVPSAVFWIGTVLLLIPWEFLYLEGVAKLLDAGALKSLIDGDYAREHVLAIAGAFVPLIVALALRLATRRPPGAGRRDA